MASSSSPFSLPSCYLLLFIVRLASSTLLLLLLLSAAPPPPLIFAAATHFSFPSFTNASFLGSPNAGGLSSDLLLLGDARFGEAFLQLSGSKPASAGGLLYRRPVDLSSNTSLSFHSSFSFLLSQSDGDALLFLMIPANSSLEDVGSCFKGQTSALLCSDLAIGFRISDHGGVFIEGLLHEVRTMPSCELFRVENGGRRLYSVIDYESSHRALRIRVRDSDMDNSSTCSIVQDFDLTNVLDGGMYVGFFSSNAKASHMNVLFSWMFQSSESLDISDSYNKSMLHSIPVDPSRYEDQSSFEKDGGGFWGSVIVGLSCLASISLLVSAIWLTFRRNSECDDAQSVGIGRCYVYQKLGTTRS